jgi:hypothetical protein
LATPHSSWAAPCSSQKFDAPIAEAVAAEWRDLPDARLWKAQLCAESALNPLAQSGVGARGLAQIMEPTWRDIARSFNWDTAFQHAFDPSRAILGGARYQGEKRRMWSATGRTGFQRNDLGLCSYNAGAGNCLAAQKLCQDARLWETISACLWMVTGEANARETKTYVVRINQYRAIVTVKP